MTLGLRLVFLLLVGGLAACGGGGGNDIVNFTFGAVRFVNAIADSPTLTVTINTTAFATVSFSQASPVRDVVTGTYTVDVEFREPDGDTVTVLNDRALDLAENEQVTMVFGGTLANPTFLVIDETEPAIAAAQAEVHFVHGAGNVGSVDIYLTEAAVDLAGATPVVTLNAGAASDLSTLAAGPTYRLRVTAAGSTTVLFDSGAFAIDALARRLFLLTDYFGPGGSGIRAVQIDTGSAGTFDAEALPGALRVANLVNDLAAVDAYLNGVAGAPPIAMLPESAVSDALVVAPSIVAVALTPAGDASRTVHTTDVTLVPGQVRTLVVAGIDGTANVTSRAIVDVVRPIAGQAQLRVVHASPATASVDLHVVAPGAAVSATSVDLGQLSLQSSGSLALDAGNYDVVFTTAGTTTVLVGPVAITVAARGIYSLFLADFAGGGVPARVVLADDFL